MGDLQFLWPKQLKKIFGVPFTTLEFIHYYVEPEQGQDIPTITQQELLRVCKKLGNTKAPELDQIPNIALEATFKAAPDLFLDMYNSCLAEGIFPERYWSIWIQKEKTVDTIQWPRAYL